MMLPQRVTASQAGHVDDHDEIHQLLADRPGLPGTTVELSSYRALPPSSCGRRPDHIQKHEQRGVGGNAAIQSHGDSSAGRVQEQFIIANRTRTLRPLASCYRDSEGRQRRQRDLPTTPARTRPTRGSRWCGGKRHSHLKSEHAPQSLLRRRGQVPASEGAILCP